MGNTGVKSNCELPEGSCQESVMKIIQKEGIGNYSIHVDAGSKKGDNYTGSIYRITVSGTDRNDCATKLSLIMKYATRLPTLRELAPHRELFEREATMYQKVLPELFKMETTPAFQEVPKLYFASTSDLDEYLIFADKMVDGFVMTDRKATLDWDHCSLVVHQLANLHAMSFVLQKKDYEKFKALALPMDDSLWHHSKIKEMFIGQQNLIVDKAARSLDPIKDAIALEKYRKFGEALYETMFDLMTMENVDEYSVITHGDCWNNNLLFKYADPKHPEKPTNICFLDWQISRWASPVIDLSYFIYNCTGTKFRLDHFDELIDFYYKKLSEAIRRMGCDPEELYPRHVLQRHMKKFFRYGVSMASQTIHMFTSDADEIPDIEDMKEINAEEMQKWHFESKNDDLYKERMGGVLRHAVAHGFI